MELTPQQELFLKGYLDPQSETFSNAKQSALQAGYKKEYAENITNLMPQWLREGLQDTGLISKALSNLSDFIDSSSDDSVDKKIKYDASKFVLERLNPKFKQKSELDGKLKLEIQPITGMKIIKEDGNI